MLYLISLSAPSAPSPLAPGPARRSFFSLFSPVGVGSEPARNCTYAADIQDRYCEGYIMGAIDGKRWGTQHTWEEVAIACNGNPSCVGVQWHNNDGGSSRAGGKYQLCRSSTTMQTNSDWNFIPATCGQSPGVSHPLHILP